VRVECEDVAAVAAVGEEDVADDDRRRLVPEAGDRLPGAGEPATRAHMEGDDALRLVDLRRGKCGPGDVEELRARRPARLGDERGRVVAQADRSDRPGREPPPIPDVEVAVLVVRGRERRAAGRPEEQRGRAEVEVARLRHRHRQIRVEDLGEVRRERDNSIPVAVRVDARALRVADRRVDAAAARLDRDAPVLPDAAEVSVARHRVERLRVGRIVDVDRDKAPLRADPVVVGHVAVRRDRHVQPFAEQPQPAPDVLVPGPLDQAHRPARRLLAGRERERVQLTARPDDVDPTAREVDRARRADPEPAALRRRDRPETAPPELLAGRGGERHHRAALGCDDHGCARPAGGYERRGDDPAVEPARPDAPEPRRRLRRQHPRRDEVREPRVVPVCGPGGRFADRCGAGGSVRDEQADDDPESTAHRATIRRAMGSGAIEPPTSRL
jgi:hypothetical protein